MIFRLAAIYVVGLLSIFAPASVSAQTTMNSLDQNADQSQGQYMPMNLNYAGFNSLGMVQSAWLDPLQNLGEGQTKPAYSRYYWSPDLVLPVRLREGMMTLINFPDWELIQDIFIGDSATFDGQITGPNTLLLYPRKGAAVGVDTNIIVFGRSGNRYVFYAKSEGVNTERLTNSIIDIEVIDDPNSSKGNNSFSSTGARGGGSGGNFTSSGGKSVDSTFTKRFQKSDWLKSIPMDPAKFRFDIEVYSPNPEDVVIAPERVWRDDIFTYIDLGEKALNMTQRPIVTLIVERMEIPVGFRSKGPNNRLIIVEGIGDLVLRNGKRVICLKLRRSDDAGLEYAPVADDAFGPQWEVSPEIPNAHTRSVRESFDGSTSYRDSIQGGDSDTTTGVIYQDSMPVGVYTGPSGGEKNDKVGGGESSAINMFDYSKMQRISNNNQYDQSAQSVPNQYSYGAGFADSNSSNISIELGTDADVSKLENLWHELADKYADVLGTYEPFFSVDTPADGQGKELFHLRIGPVENLDKGDRICSRLGRNGIFCSVVRTQ